MGLRSIWIFIQKWRVRNTLQNLIELTKKNRKYLKCPDDKEVKLIFYATHTKNHLHLLVSFLYNLLCESYNNSSEYYTLHFPMSRL